MKDLIFLTTCFVGIIGVQSMENKQDIYSATNYFEGSNED